MIINLVFDAAAQAAPAAFRNTLQQAANIIASMFSDNITISIGIEYNEGGIAAGSAESGPAGGLYESYSSVYNYLVGSASPGDSSFDSLPIPGSAGAPSEVAVWDAQLKAMGLSAVSSEESFAGSLVDGVSNFSASISPSLLLGVALHELTHAMGRVPFDDSSGDPDIMEFDRFVSPGDRLANESIPAPASYFSINGGVGKWAVYGQGSDPSDFLNSQNYSGYGTSNLSVEDAFNEYYDNNTLQYLTPLDLEQMDVLGFHLKQDAPAVDNYDFNGANFGDILLQSSSGQIEYANMAGGSFQGYVNLANTPGWSVVGQGKISGGVDSDVVIEDNGQIEYADLVNGVFSHWVYVCDVPGWNVVAVGDVNGDHYADLVIQNSNSSNGGIDYINMDNGQFNGFYGLPSTPGWKAVAVADIADNGFDDIVIQNTSTGEITVANMTNGVFNTWVEVTGTPGYNVVGAGEITRSGYDNIVIQSPTSGDIDFANMNGGVFDNWVDIGSVPGWNVIGVEDILGNGYDDIVIQNSSSGQIEYANMTGGVFNGWVNITTPPSGFVGETGPGGGESGDQPGAGGVSYQQTSIGGDPDQGSDSDQTALTNGGGYQQQWTFGYPQTWTNGDPDQGSDSGLTASGPSPGAVIGPVLDVQPGIPNGDGNVQMASSMSAAGSMLGAGAADAGVWQSASWLTAGSNPGGTAGGFASQPANLGAGSNPTSPMTADADNLHTALHLGT